MALAASADVDFLALHTMAMQASGEIGAEQILDFAEALGADRATVASRAALEAPGLWRRLPKPSRTGPNPEYYRHPRLRHWHPNHSRRGGKGRIDPYHCGQLGQHQAENL